MKFQKKSISKIALTDLLRRKRTNLTKYLLDNGIFSYELLTARCFSIGVIPPTEEQFFKARGTSNSLHEVSSPTEGIVVLNADLILHEQENEVLNSSQDDLLVEKTLSLILVNSNDNNLEEEVRETISSSEIVKKFSRKNKNHH